jgi:hypothetical protein
MAKSRKMFFSKKKANTKNQSKRQKQIQKNFEVIRQIEALVV